MTASDVRRCPKCGSAWIALDVAACTRCAAGQSQTARSKATAATRIQFKSDTHLYIAMPFGEVAKRVDIARRRGHEVLWLDGRRIVLSEVHAIHPPAPRQEAA